jgi:hypothetical protein
MRALIAAAGIVATATSAQAETWTCTFVTDGSNEALLFHFQVSATELIEPKYDGHYQILQNNSYGLVATEAISKIEEGQQKPTVGASTVIIDKATGEFLWGTFIAGLKDDGLGKPVRGTCIKD